jgi:hypothetical protein
MAVLTAGLRNLQRQLDAAFPGRAGPDGWLGDAAHRARTSGHNPDDTAGSRPAWDGDADSTAEVRAVDVDADLGPGVDGQHLVNHLVRLPGLAGVVRYLIHRGRIYHARTGFLAEPYDGDNPHNEHIHIEGAWAQAADNNTSFDYRLEEIPVPLTIADAELVVDRLMARTIPGHGSFGGTVATRMARTGNLANISVPALAAAVQTLSDTVATLSGDLAYLKSGLDKLTADPAETGFAHPMVAAAEHAEDNEPPA